MAAASKSASARPIRHGHGCSRPPPRRRAKATAGFSSKRTAFRPASFCSASRLDDGNLQIDTAAVGEHGRRNRSRRFAAELRRPYRRRDRFDRRRERRRQAASRSSTPSSSSTGTRRIASCRCRSRSFPAATASPCLARSRRRSEAAGTWLFKIGGGTIVLNPAGATGEPLVLNRIAIGGRYDAAKQRFTHRRRRYRQYQRRHRHVRQPGFCRRQSASGGRPCRHAHAGRCA